MQLGIQPCDLPATCEFRKVLSLARKGKMFHQRMSFSFAERIFFMPEFISLRTAEFVTPQHPDKICDFIADTLLDSYLLGDPNSRVAVEVMGGHGFITLNGEVTSTAKVNAEKIVAQIVGPDFKVLSNIAKQSPEIAPGVDAGGAGDQGIMVGYACAETESLMPLEYELARGLCQKIYEVYPFDGKVQVTLDGLGAREQVKCVVASFQNTKSSELEKLVREFLPGAKQYLINPAGDWNQGGFDADSGLSGRKLVVDNYGPQVPLGGGSFSGKDYTKVDRSGAYMARKVAVDLLQITSRAVKSASSGRATVNEVTVKLAYAIGVAHPVMATAYFNGTSIDITDRYDFTPAGIRSALALDKVKYSDTCTWGHFGRGFAWDEPFAE